MDEHSPLKKTFGFVCAADPFNDRVAWSGTFYKIREAIQNAGFNVVWVPVKKNGFVELCYKFFLTLHEFLFCKGKKIMSGSNRPFIAKLRGRAIRKNEAYKSCDAFFFSGGAGGAQLSLFMDLLGKPSIFYTDATFPIELSRTSAELKAGLELLEFSPTEELLCSSPTTLDEEAATGGISGDGESSEQALNIAQAPAANIELNKIFFIIIL